MNEILNIIHKTIYQFFDVCEDDVEASMSDKDKLLLEVNKAICNNLKTAQQNLQPTCNQLASDCISREAALDVLDDYAEDIERGNWGTAYSKARASMCELQSVEPERKTGHWHLLDECANEGWYCDQCHKKVFKADFSNTMRKYKFCPNCGSYNGGSTHVDE